ncbi:MAG TPA: lipoprotein [Afifellaceae bacterium]|nr:lipoprotein [Afifellaceae bacterium]
MPILRLAVVAVTAAVGLAGCGVRGDLEPPPGAEAAAAQTAQADRVEVEAPIADFPNLEVSEDENVDSERVIQSQRRTLYPPMSDSFVLDPLL